MQDLDREPETAREWFNRACVESILAKAYENVGYRWMAQPHAEQAVHALANGLKMLVVESIEASDARLR